MRTDEAAPTQDGSFESEEADCQRRYRENIKIQCPDGMSEDLRRILLEGLQSPGDSGTPQDLKPAWYDPDLFRDGQACALRYLAGICEGQLLSLFVEFSVPHGMDPLIATGRSDTPFAAFQRYVSTAQRLLSWYEGDPFDPKSLAWKNLVAVRRMHSAVRKMCTSTPRDELAVKFTVGKCSQSDGPASLLCPMTPSLAEKMKRVTLPYAGITVEMTDSLDRPFLTQGEMSTTQFSFFGLFILHPELFGAPYVSRRELEGLVHMWAVLAHCLGVQDRYNFCVGGLEPTLQRSRELVERVFKNFFLSLTPKWEHMSRCAFEGTKMYVPGLGVMEAHLAYLVEDVFQMNSGIPKMLSWLQWFELMRLRFSLQVLPRWFPSIIHLASKVVRGVILEASKFSKEKMQQLQHKRFEFSSMSLPLRLGTAPAS